MDFVLEALGFGWPVLLVVAVATVAKQVSRRQRARATGHAVTVTLAFGVTWYLSEGTADGGGGGDSSGDGGGDGGGGGD